MKHFNTRTVPEKTETYCRGTTCDFCNNRLDFVKCADYSVVEISHEEGVNYPEYSQYTKLHIHACPTCFTSKILPKLKEIAISEFYVEEYED
jgi:hypothetical protein